MTYLNIVAEASCILVGVTGICVGAFYRSRIAKTPLTEAMWATGFAQMWLGTAFDHLEGDNTWRLLLVALGVALAQYRIWAVLRERAPTKIAG